MKFDTLYNNLIIEQDNMPVPPEQDIPQSAEQPTAQDAAINKVPHPDNFDDVKPMPPVETDSVQEKLKQQIAKLVKLAQEVNGFEGSAPSIQQEIYSLDQPGSVYNGISGVVANDITSAAGSLLDAANKLSKFVISTSKRAQDLAASR